MNEEKLLDAMAYLPEDMLAQTDKLRSKKTIHWQPVAAAACLCILIGVGWSWLFPGAKSMDGSAPEHILTDDMEAGVNVSTSGSTVGMLAQVLTVTADTLTVKKEDMTYTVELEDMETVPSLVPGQWVRIFALQISPDETIRPYKIIIEEEIP